MSPSLPPANDVLWVALILVAMLVASLTAMPATLWLQRTLERLAEERAAKQEEPEGHTPR